MSNERYPGCEIWPDSEERGNIECDASNDLLGGIMFLIVGIAVWLLSIISEFPVSLRNNPEIVIAFLISAYCFCSYARNRSKLKKSR